VDPLPARLQRAEGGAAECQGTGLQRTSRCKNVHGCCMRTDRGTIHFPHRPEDPRGVTAQRVRAVCLKEGLPRREEGPNRGGGEAREASTSHSQAPLPPNPCLPWQSLHSTRHQSPRGSFAPRVRAWEVRQCARGAGSCRGTQAFTTGHWGRGRRRARRPGEAHQDAGRGSDGGQGKRGGRWSPGRAPVHEEPLYYRSRGRGGASGSRGPQEEPEEGLRAGTSRCSSCPPRRCGSRTRGRAGSPRGGRRRPGRPPWWRRSAAT